MATSKEQAEIFTRVEKTQIKMGDVMSQEILWNPQSWIDTLNPSFSKSLTYFAAGCRQDEKQHVITRRDVVNLSEGFEELFIGSMIFGFGPIGYGPFRVKRMLEMNHGWKEKLQQQYLAATKGPALSWESHTRVNRVKYLGPAFATKFAYFAARHQEAKGDVPLIADVNTSRAMWQLAKIPRSAQRKAGYLEYVRLAHSWGAQVGGDYGADEIERALFEIGKNLPRVAS